MEESRETMMKTIFSASILVALSVSAGGDPEVKHDEEPTKVVAARAHVTPTVMNLRQLSLALIEFDNNYGAFPCDETVRRVTEATGSYLTRFKGEASNAYFRQLLATHVKTEAIFQIGGGKAPDNDFKDDSKALAKGECGIAYIPGLDGASDPSTPVAFAPMVPGKLAFDPVPLGGKAVVLRIDGSVTVETMTQAGEVVTADGKSIFDPAQPYWKGKAPKVAWPE